jgi:hypothetical protein
MGTACSQRNPGRPASTEQVSQVEIVVHRGDERLDSAFDLCLHGERVGFLGQGAIGPVVVALAVPLERIHRLLSCS